MANSVQPVRGHQDYLPHEVKVRMPSSQLF